MRNVLLLITAASLIIGGIAFYGAKSLAEAASREQTTTIDQIEQLAHPELTVKK